MDKGSSSANPSPSYDIFLSLADPNYFMKWLLEEALTKKRFKVHCDKVVTRWQEVSEAIENSKLAIVIFSELYHHHFYQRWLDELVHILECRVRKGMRVLLVFHGIEPLEVQKLQGKMLEERYGKDSDEVVAWKDAFTTIEGISIAKGSNSQIHDIISSAGLHLMAIYSALVGEIVQGLENSDLVFTSDTACPMEYDVFLSFNNKDTCNSFTSHLCAALKRRGISTYCDNTERESQTLSEFISQHADATQKSKLYLVIFSKKYILSWCQYELELIFRYSEKFKRVVVPFFYDVDPSLVQNQLESLQWYHTMGSTTLLPDSDSMHGYKVILSEKTRLLGWDSKINKHESELVEEIVVDIIKKLERVQSNDISDLVRISERVSCVRSMLESGSREVRIVSIEGMAGIGKTTLAKALYDQISNLFEASCFLANVRESWDSGRKKYLQNKIVSELSDGLDIKIGRDGLKRKKVLIILDDIWGEEQLELLVGHRNNYGTGSRIIITGRDNRALNVADDVYRMTELSVAEASFLFQLNAFKTKSPTENFVRLSSMIVRNFPKRIPFAIKVLGSVLCGKSSESWTEVLEQLKNVSSDEIQQVLRICYAQLEEEQKNIFLDIACFFKGNDEVLTKRTLDGCWTVASEIVEDLVDMSLITIRDSKLWMHDFVEDLGKKIVQEESIEDPGRRSRLWDADDIYRVFENRTGTVAVKAIFLDMSRIKKVELHSLAFSRMYHLRILKLYHHFASCTLQFPEGDLQFLPSELRYLYWDAYPLKSLPLGPGNNLVELWLRFSKVEQLWQRGQRLENLKVIDLSFSKQLVEFPNISRAPNVESVNLRGCGSLREVPLYVHRLVKLISLNLADCSSLEKILALPSNIIHVDLARCNRLQSLPSNMSELLSLRRLELSGCSSLDLTNFKKFSLFEKEEELPRYSKPK